MFLNRYRKLRRLQEVRKVEINFARLRKMPVAAGLGEDLDSGVDGGKVIEFDDVGVA